MVDNFYGGLIMYMLDMDGTKNLGEYIYEEFIEKNELDNSTYENQKKNLELLVETGYALRKDSRMYVYNKKYNGSMAPEYCFMSYFMVKHNPELKELLKIDPFNNSTPIKSKKVKKIFKTQMGSGVHYARIGKKNFIALVVDTKQYNDEDNNEDSIIVSIYFIGKKARKLSDKYVAEYEDFYKEWKKENNKTYVYTSYNRGESRIFKTFDQYIFSNKDKVLKYIDHWKKNIPTYYEKYNMTPKLSILLYGKPGTGKSTFYQCLARYLNFDNCCLINTSNIYDKFPTLGFYIIDEIDLFCKSRKATSKDGEDGAFNKENSYMLQQLLAFLDNPPTFDYRLDNGQTYPISVVVATTNYFDQLDDAVKRYGRFDLQIELKDFNKSEAEEMCDLYDLTLDSVLATDEINIKPFTISPAKLQALCLKNVDNNLKGGNE